MSDNANDAIDFFKTSRKFSFLSSRDSSRGNTRQRNFQSEQSSSLPSLVPKYDLQNALKIGKKNEKYSPFYKKLTLLNDKIEIYK